MNRKPQYCWHGKSCRHLKMGKCRFHHPTSENTSNGHSWQKNQILHPRSVHKQYMMQNNGKRVFVEAAMNYLLVVKLFRKGLAIELTDNEDNIIYQNSYSDKKEINGLDIVQIFSVFNDEFISDDYDDEESYLEENFERKIQTNNQIGDIVSSQNGQYRVLQRGKIELRIDLMYPSSSTKTFSQELLLELKETRKIDIHDKFDMKLKNLQMKLQIKHEKEINKLKEFYEEKLKQKAAINTIDKKISYSEKFIILNNQIIYNGEDEVWTQLLMKDIIPIHGEVSFRLVVRKTKNNQIIFGICDKRKRAEERSSFNSGFETSYLAENGYVYGHKCTQGEGFKQNQEVIMTVNLSLPKVTWKVNGVSKAFSVVDILKNQNSFFVPYIEMYNKGDVVNWDGKVDVSKKDKKSDENMKKIHDIFNPFKSYKGEEKQSQKK